MDREPRWRELDQAASAASLPPVERRRAERLLLARLSRLTVGERTALARRASRGIVVALAATSEPRVLLALLANPRLVEADVVGIAASPTTSPDVLSRVADDPRWGARPAVARALAVNPRSPVPTALRAVARLSREERSRLAGDGSVPQIVRVGASRSIDDQERDPDGTAPA
jgi:hypothetical protein